MTTDRNSEGAELLDDVANALANYSLEQLHNDPVGHRLTVALRERLREYRASTPADAEPVAWRMMQAEESGWALTQFQCKVDEAAALANPPRIEPLYTTPPSSIPAAEVQALVERWRESAALMVRPQEIVQNMCADELAKLIPRNPE